MQNAHSSTQRALSPHPCVVIRFLLLFSILGGTAACQQKPSTYPTLRLQMQHPDPVMRQHAVDAFVQHKEAAVLPLLMVLAERSEVAKSSARRAFQRLGTHAIPALSQAIRQRRWRPWVAEALRSIGPPALPTLREMTQASEAILRWQAFSLLADIAPKHAEVLALALRGLDDPHDGVRGAACLVLERMGKHATPALSALLGALQKKAQPNHIKMRILLVLEQVDLRALTPHHTRLRLMQKNTSDPTLRSALARLLAVLDRSLRPNPPSSRPIRE